MTTQVATLGGGCFWCLEAALLQLKGVESVVSGYAGRATGQPDYHAICSGRTGSKYRNQPLFSFIQG